MAQLNLLLQQIESSQELFAQKLKRLEAEGITAKQYSRYLRAQYHLTKGVQRHFYLVAAHPELAHFRSIRDFLINFSYEEEFHFDVAKGDLKNLEQDTGAMPFWVQCWWAYFDQRVLDSPFTRLGATAILENISKKSDEIVMRLLTKTTFLNEKNTVFFQIHRHQGNLAHGDQILEQLSKLSLKEEQVKALEEGARNAARLYLATVDWALFSSEET